MMDRMMCGVCLACLPAGLATAEDRVILDEGSCIRLRYTLGLLRISSKRLKTDWAAPGLDDASWLRHRLGRGWQTVRLSFEIHFDGRVVAQSGLMRADEPARRLVATWPRDAKELKLVTRPRADVDGPLGPAYGNWGDPTLYREK